MQLWSLRRYIKKLEAILKATGFAAGQTADDIEELAISIGRNTYFMDAMSLSGRAVSSSFDSLTASLSNVATAVNANKRRIREQEIDNKNSLMETNLKTDVADFKFKIKENKTLNTEGDYLKAWEKFEKEMIPYLN